MVDKIKRHLPSDITIHNVKLEETPTSYAEWFACDNY
jgi:6-pyruvoyltetrahydropterin/6-carboxytetrahydropterin synthase